jgi:hypothetical protein
MKCFISSIEVISYNYCRSTFNGYGWFFYGLEPLLWSVWYIRNFNVVFLQQRQWRWLLGLSTTIHQMRNIYKIINIKNDAWKVIWVSVETDPHPNWSQMVVVGEKFDWAVILHMVLPPQMAVPCSQPIYRHFPILGASMTAHPGTVLSPSIYEDNSTTNFHSCDMLKLKSMSSECVCMCVMGVCHLHCQHCISYMA